MDRRSLTIFCVILSCLVLVISEAVSAPRFAGAIMLPTAIPATPVPDDEECVWEPLENADLSEEVIDITPIEIETGDDCIYCAVQTPVPTPNAPAIVSMQLSLMNIPATPTAECCDPVPCQCAKLTIQQQIDELHREKDLKVALMRSLDSNMKRIQEASKVNQGTIQEILNRNPLVDTLYTEVSLGLDVLMVSKCAKSIKMLYGTICGARGVSQCDATMKANVKKPTTKITPDQVQGAVKKSGESMVKVCKDGAIAFVGLDRVQRCLTQDEILAAVYADEERLQVEYAKLASSLGKVRKQVEEIDRQINALRKELNKRCC